MSSTGFSRTQRAALVSPGAVLAPRNDGKNLAFVRDRIGLLAKLLLCLGAFFLVVGNIHRAVFQGFESASTFFGPAHYIHTGILVFIACILVATRSRLENAAALAVLDCVLVVGTLAGYAVQATYMDFARMHRLDEMLLLVLFIFLSSRAVVVPSTGARTALIGVLGAVPVICYAVWGGETPGGAASAATFSSMFCSAAVALSTFTSSVIYGLRETVARAQEVGQYVIERKLGEGGMGEVYLAHHTMLRRPTAVKLLPPERAGEGTVARFEREVRETSRLTHPNTVAIYDYGRTREGIFYYAMEYLDGLDLERLVEDEGPLEPARVIHVLSQIAGALAEAHGRGLVHRDMKPANVILCNRGGLMDTVKVLDFGLVKDVGAPAGDLHQTAANSLIGTPAYMSPEAIVAPERVDARSDLYAVGAIGYYLLTGKEVFASSSIVSVCASHIQERPVPPTDRIGRPLPADLESLILRCLEKDPSLRPPSARELRKALLACDVPSWTLALGAA